jgi:hypothetical protein
MISTMKTTNHRGKKLNKTIEDGKISHAHGLVEPTLWKWLNYQKQSTCSLKSPSKFQWHSSQRLKNQP